MICNHLANIVTASRILCVPIMVWLAWNQSPISYLVLLAYCFASDLVDGYIARSFGSSSAFGAQMDSWSDFLVYSTMPLCGYWLWPDRIVPETILIVIAVLSYVVPILFGFIRFKTITSYHTLGAKLSALAVGGGAWLMFAGAGPWPFRLAIPIAVFAAIEQIAISVVLKKHRTDIPTFWHAWREQEIEESTNKR